MTETIRIGTDIPLASKHQNTPFPQSSDIKLGKIASWPTLKSYSRKKIETDTSSGFQIFRDNDGYRVSYLDHDFSEPTETLVGALDLKKRIETLLTVHETCTKIETFKRECDFYVKKAELTVGNEYNDLFIDSHTGPFFQKTNALTHERLMLIYGAKKGKSMNIQLSQYLNEIIWEKKTSTDAKISVTQ